MCLLGGARMYPDFPLYSLRQFIGGHVKLIVELTFKPKLRRGYVLEFL